MSLKSLINVQVIVSVAIALVLYDLFIKTWAAGLFAGKPYDNTFDGVNNFEAEPKMKIFTHNGEEYLQMPNGKTYRLPQAA